MNVPRCPASMHFFPPWAVFLPSIETAGFPVACDAPLMSRWMAFCRWRVPSRRFLLARPPIALFEQRMPDMTLVEAPVAMSTMAPQGVLGAEPDPALETFLVRPLIDTVCLDLRHDKVRKNAVFNREWIPSHACGCAWPTSHLGVCQAGMGIKVPFQRTGSRFIFERKTTVLSAGR
jgi:hypothetical protein